MSVQDDVVGDLKRYEPKKSNVMLVTLKCSGDDRRMQQPGLRALLQSNHYCAGIEYGG